MVIHIKLLSLLGIISMLKLSYGFIKVKDTENNLTIITIPDAESQFGGEFKQGEMAYLIESHPILACNKTIDPPPINLSNTSNIIFVALIKRGLCNFDHKIRTAQNSGYQGVIIYNNDSDDYFQIKVPYYSRDIHIPSRMIGFTSGYQLRQYTFTFDRQQFVLIFFDNQDFNPIYYIIAFLGFVSLGFIIIGIGFVIKLCRDCAKRRANRLKKCHLKRIPVKKFKKGEDQYEMCAICLDDFEDGDRLRILPCNHAYHIKCIDPWLLKQKRNCPVCKSRVKIPGRDEESDDNVSIVAQEAQTVSVNANENTPLINPRDNGGSQSYFSNTDVDINFIPEPQKSSSPNCYENPCIDIDEVNVQASSTEDSIDVIVIGMSINNDVDCDTPSNIHTTPLNSTQNTTATGDLTKIV